MYFSSQYWDFAGQFVLIVSKEGMTGRMQACMYINVIYVCVYLYTYMYVYTNMDIYTYMYTLLMYAKDESLSLPPKLIYLLLVT